MKSSGLQKRSYCYSVDCAIQILTALLKGEKGQAYNIGHDEITTIRQMAKIYAEAGNVKLIIADASVFLDTGGYDPPAGAQGIRSV